MDIYRFTVDYFCTFPIFGSWQEMKTVLQRAASTRLRDWELPIIACQAVGESAEKVSPASTAVACPLTSILLVDDMLDHDPRGEYRRIGSGRTSNLALAFQSACMDALLNANSSIRLAAMERLNRMMLATARGQELGSKTQQVRSLTGAWAKPKVPPFSAARSSSREY